MFMCSTCLLRISNLDELTLYSKLHVLFDFKILDSNIKVGKGRAMANVTRNTNSVLLSSIIILNQQAFVYGRLSVRPLGISTVH